MTEAVQIFIGILLLIVGLSLYGFVKWQAETSEISWSEVIVLLVIGLAGIGIIGVADQLLPDPTLTNRTRWIIGGLCIGASIACYLWLRSRVDELTERNFLILYGLTFILFILGVRVIVEL